MAPHSLDVSNNHLAIMIMVSYLIEVALPKAWEIKTGSFIKKRNWEGAAMCSLCSREKVVCQYNRFEVVVTSNGFWSMMIAS
jgi:hypothetical protein